MCDHILYYSGYFYTARLAFFYFLLRLVEVLLALVSDSTREGKHPCHNSNNVYHHVYKNHTYIPLLCQRNNNTHLLIVLCVYKTVDFLMDCVLVLSSICSNQSTLKSRCPFLSGKKLSLKAMTSFTSCPDLQNSTLSSNSCSWQDQRGGFSLHLQPKQSLLSPS